MGRIVIACFRPLPGKQEQLRALTETHVQRLRDLGLATDRSGIAMEAGTSTWSSVSRLARSAAAVGPALDRPEVLAMWAEYERCCTDIAVIARCPVAGAVGPRPRSAAAAAGSARTAPGVGRHRARPSRCLRRARRGAGGAQLGDPVRRVARETAPASRGRCPPTAVFSHASAAHVLGLWNPRPRSPLVHVTVPGRSGRDGRRCSGSTDRRCRRARRRARRARRCTTVARTAVDLARVATCRRPSSSSTARCACCWPGVPT